MLLFLWTVQQVCYPRTRVGSRLDSTVRLHHLPPAGVMVAGGGWRAVLVTAPQQWGLPVPAIPRGLPGNALAAWWGADPTTPPAAHNLACQAPCRLDKLLCRPLTYSRPPAHQSPSQPPAHHLLTHPPCCCRCCPAAAVAGWTPDQGIEDSKEGAHHPTGPRVACGWGSC